MTDVIPFFDGHNDFLLRLKNAPEQRDDLWLGATGAGHLDLARMKQGGFAGGLFAIWVPSVSNTPAVDYKELMQKAPFEVPLPELMNLTEAQPAALAMAGHFHWMERVAPKDFVICCTP